MSGRWCVRPAVNGQSHPYAVRTLSPLLTRQVSTVWKMETPVTCAIDVHVVPVVPSLVREMRVNAAVKTGAARCVADSNLFLALYSVCLRLRTLV